MPQISSYQSDGTQSGTRRRDFLWNSLSATALLTTGSWVHAPVLAGGEKPHITMLSWNNFVPEADVELRRQAEEYSKRTGVQVSVDFMVVLHR